MYATILGAVLNLLGRLLPFLFAYLQGRSSVKKDIAEKSVEVANEAENIDARPVSDHVTNVNKL